MVPLLLVLMLWICRSDPPNKPLLIVPLAFDRCQTDAPAPAALVADKLLDDSSYVVTDKKLVPDKFELPVGNLLPLGGVCKRWHSVSDIEYPLGYLWVLIPYSQYGIPECVCGKVCGAYIKIPSPSGLVSANIRVSLGLV
jgi:hypothetical protein